MSLLPEIELVAPLPFSYEQLKYTLYIYIYVYTYYKVIHTSSTGRYINVIHPILST